MKLFSSTQISWNEPWLFLIRIRQAKGWAWRLFLALAIAAVMFVALFFFAQRGLPGAIGVSLAAGFVLVALLDVANLQREVSISEESILVTSAVSWGWGWMSEFKLGQIESINLARPAEWGEPYGGLVINSKDDNFLVAVPNKVALEALADILHRLKVDVSLSDWQPSDHDTRIAVRNELELDPAAAQGEISLQAVGEQEGPLLAPSHLAIQVVIALGPLLLALIGAIGVGVVLFRNWGVMSVLDKCLHGGGAAAALVVTFLYLVLVGQFVAASYGIGVARKRLQSRPQAIFAGTEHDLVSVEIFERESWTATIAKSADFGFLQIDRGPRSLRFEGNKFRWTLPLAALTACRIEESIVGSEADAHAERRYYVVIAANHEGQVWEAGMVYTRTEMGNDHSEARYKRAQLLFAQLADAV